MLFNKIMLYDEEGRAYVERPLIPEEQHLFYIVRDYKRMYHDYWSIKSKVEKLQETNVKLSNCNFALTRNMQAYRDAIRHAIKHAIKYMKKHGVNPSPYLLDFTKRKLII